MKTIIIRAAQAMRLFSFRGQRGAVDISVLQSLVCTLLILANSGFNISDYPELGTQLSTDCSNIDELKDPAAVKKCADTMLSVSATAIMQSNALGLLLLSTIEDPVYASLYGYPYSIYYSPKPSTPLPYEKIQAEFLVKDKAFGGYMSKKVNLSVSGTNGYRNDYTANTPITHTINEGAPSGTVITYKVSIPEYNQTESFTTRVRSVLDFKNVYASFYGTLHTETLSGGTASSTTEIFFENWGYNGQTIPIVWIGNSFSASDRIQYVVWGDNYDVQLDISGKISNDSQVLETISCFSNVSITNSDSTNVKITTKRLAATNLPLTPSAGADTYLVKDADLDNSLQVLDREFTQYVNGNKVLYSKVKSWSKPASVHVTFDSLTK